MDSELPKRLFIPGSEPEVEHINNYCRLGILDKLESRFENEYREVKRDPVFSQILAFHDNKLSYSARMIHSMLVRQLETDKRHELWFEFARRPLRFSMQEYYAVTGLKCDVSKDIDFDKWEYDDGFWSKLLRREENITLEKIWDDYIKGVDDWRRVDRFRLIYLCVIVGVILARGDRAVIPLEYIKVVLDMEKFRAYAWGRVSYDLLLKSVFKSRKKMLKAPKSYVLEGFSYALQIWAMEAIPAVGKLLGTKLTAEFIAGPRCSNWQGAAKVSYDEIKRLEKTITEKDDIYPYISWTGNGELLEDNRFARTDVRDCRVDFLNGLIRKDYDWTKHVWEVAERVETASIHEEHEEADVEMEDEDAEDDFRTPMACESTHSGSTRGKKRRPDHGFEKRKQKLLFERSNPTLPAVDDELKKFIQHMFETSFTALVEKLEQKFETRVDALECQITQLRNEITPARGKTIDGGTATSSEPAKDDTFHDGKKKEAENLFDLNFSQSSDINMNMGTQEYLHKTMGGLSQDSNVTDFDPTPPSKTQNPIPWWTPSTTFRVSRVEIPKHASSSFGENWGTKRWKELKLTDDPVDPDQFADSPLTYVSDDLWNQFQEWSMKPVELKIGPHVFTMKMADTIMKQTEWFTNEEMDSLMFLWRERTTLHRWKPDRVAFMTCWFCTQVNTSYLTYSANKKGFVMDQYLLAYGNGELPAHGRTRKVWGVDIDRIYLPLNVDGTHWISMCIDILERKIEVWDCFGRNYRSVVQKFAIMIPKIVKAVQNSTTKKQLTVNPYSIKLVPMKRRLNKTCCDCGAYAIKFMECHLLGLDISLVDDENILGCRYKIAVDLWQAANDPELVDRMSKFEPPQIHSSDSIVSV